MGLRQIRMSIDIDESLTAIVLENGDVVIDNVGPHPVNRDIVMTAIEYRIDSLNVQVQRLHLIRDLLKLEERVEREEENDMPPEDSVNPFYKITDHGPCADCDRPAELTVSQWGKTKHGDLVCVRCEMVREQEYGLPLVDPD